MKTDLQKAYLWHKQNPWRAYGDIRRPAEIALERARVDVAAGKARYPRDKRYSAPGGAFAGYGTEAMRWCESPADIGLRFVGYADKLARIGHTGWWTDSDGMGESVRGVVYQLPARNGRPVYVSGYDNAVNGAADNGGPAAIDFGTLWYGDVGGETADSDHYGEHATAAYHADELAERMAETEREYQTAWQAGSQWAERADEIAAERKATLQLIGEFKNVRMTFAGAANVTNLCAAIREKIESGLERIRELRDERAQLASGDFDSLYFYPSAELKAAFNEGAGQTVLA